MNDCNCSKCQRNIKPSLRTMTMKSTTDKPIETKALADAKRNAFYAKLWVTLNSLSLLIIIYAVINFLRG